MKDIPQELDWVNERAKCDIKKAFEHLRQAVQKDVEQYNTQSGLQSHYPIEFSSEPNWLFSVVRRSNLVKATVFNREGDHIEITLNAAAQQPLKAVPVLTETGHCKFRIEGEGDELLFEWQLRRRVLEPLFFANLRV